MSWPLVSRSRLDLALHNLEEMRALHKADVEYYRNRLAGLEEKYHALRVAGHEAPPPVFVPPENPMTQLGPLTRAALHDMGHGQSGIVKRAMQSKAFLIWLDQKNEANRDELTAIAVRQGETR